MFKVKKQIRNKYYQKNYNQSGSYDISIRFRKDSIVEERKRKKRRKKPQILNKRTSTKHVL